LGECQVWAKLTPRPSSELVQNSVRALSLSLSLSLSRTHTLVQTTCETPNCPSPGS
jgi:hypothetical protein